ncbi:hypothetical protein NMG60_11018050 [Bertholletia excelsa]
MEDTKVYSVTEDLEDGGLRPEIGGDSRDSHRIDAGLSERALSFTKLYQPPEYKPKTFTTLQTLVLSYQALGIVYGDLGTSFLNVAAALDLPNPSEDVLLGFVSIITWTTTLLVLIKYTFVVIQADDHGEGGTFALYSLLTRHINFRTKFTIQNKRLKSDESMRYYSGGSVFQSKTKKFLEESIPAQSLVTFIVLFATCMVIGDGVLTPSTCVLPALQGILASSPKVTQGYVIAMSVVILVALFAFQRYGTSKVAYSFSPVMLIWFATNTCIGLYNILKYHPSMIRGVSPHYIVKFFQVDRKTAWNFLGTAFMSITGAEAMFADLGHFSKRSIQIGYLVAVYPATIITYIGMAAFLLKNPDQLDNAYYGSIPKKVYWPMFVVSTLAAIVSSQSMISATFSLIKQSLALDCFPRVKIVHTSSKHEGQVYCPEINYALMVLCVALVLGFKNSQALANAYGVVVIWVMITTTCLATLVMLVVWDTNFLLICAFFVPCIILEGIFLASLMRKIPQGGWVPYAVSAVLLMMMLSWTYGRSRRSRYDAERKMSLVELNHTLAKGNIHRTPGICFFCTDLVNGIPPIVRHYLQNTKSVRQIMVILTLRTLPIKTVLPEERFIVGKLGIDGVYRCMVQFGYKDPISMEGEDSLAAVAAKLQEVAETSAEKEKLDLAIKDGAVFVMGRIVLRARKNEGLFARWTINYMYRFIQKNCRSAFTPLQLPSDNTMQVGMLYEI